MTKLVSVGNVAVGNGNKIAVQSMCTVRTADVEGVVRQIHALEKAGCDIIRVSVLDEADALAIAKIRQSIHIPLVADIHFSPRLAVLAIESGADKVRLNPGNIGGEREIALVADAVRAHRIPVRVGSNTGSIEREFLARYGRSDRALVESALYNVRILERLGVQDIVISVKSSNVQSTIRAYRMLAEQCDYPLHLGVTEAGTAEMGKVKSAIGIGALLCDGIGDTIRVSLNEDPVQEIYAAKNILRACGLEAYAEVVACPTCGRCEWNSMRLAHLAEEELRSYRGKLKVAIMGCVVNGPGEAADADIGIAGAKDYCVLFKKGKVYRRIPAADAEREFMAELKQLTEQ